MRHMKASLMTQLITDYITALTIPELKYSGQLSMVVELKLCTATRIVSLNLLARSLPYKSRLLEQQNFYYGDRWCLSCPNGWI